MNTMRFILGLSVLLVTGCQTCETPTFTRKPDSSDPWNTNYLIDAKPNDVSIAEVHSRAITLTAHYWAYSQVDGVLWPAWRTDPGLDKPDRWINGGDSGIYTGQALAAFAFEYGATKTPESLARVKETLKGLYLLTHASGTPGVLQRNSAPLARGAEFGWPNEQWASRDQRFINAGPVLNDPYTNQPIGQYIYYSRATKDQLTGMLLGLAAVWHCVDVQPGAPAAQTEDVVRIRELARRISEAIYTHLKKHKWWIRDENGKNDTNADYVNHLLRANVLALQVHMGNAALQKEYDEEFEHFIDLSNTLAYGDMFNNFQQYYAHNLRACRSLTIWLLEGPLSDKGQAMRDYIEKNLWKYVRGHKSAWFALIRAGTKLGDQGALNEGLYSLKSLSLKPTRMWSSPYHGQEQKPNILNSLICHRRFVIDPHLRKPEDYSTWQKEPWDTGSGEDWDKEALGEASGLDYLLPYWLARFLKLL